jgi:hypothetical protein
MGRNTTTFTVRATRQQAARWGGAAQYDGAPSIAAWLATLASQRLRYLGRYVPRLALRWRRARFRVMERPGGVGEPQPREVSGIAAGPFGIHRDPRDTQPPYRSPLFHLVHVPTGRHLVELPLRKRCKSLARELATFNVDWTATDPEQVDGPEMWRARDAIGSAHHAAYGSPERRSA